MKHTKHETNESCKILQVIKISVVQEKEKKVTIYWEMASNVWKSESVMKEENSLFLINFNTKSVRISREKLIRFTVGT